MKLKERTRFRITAVICILLFVITEICIIQSDRLGISAFNGVLTAAQFGVCLFLIKKERKKSIWIAGILMGVSAFMVLRVMLMGNIIQPLPGFCNCVIYILVLFMLNEQFHIQEKEAITDYETGLLNHRGIDRIIKRRQENKESFGILYIDLANFRMLKDNYKQGVGNQILKEIAKRLTEMVGQHGEVFRIYGNEFGVLLYDTKEIEDISNEVYECIKKKIDIQSGTNSIEIMLTPYIGVAIYPLNPDDYKTEDVLQYAEIAMDRAKQEKALTVYTYNQSMKESLTRRVEIENVLNESLTRDYFYFVYQPQFSVSDKKLRGFEALLRLTLPDGRIYSPGEFIPVAEKSGYSTKLDYYVLRKAMTEFKEILKINPNLMISINVSAKTICNPDFTQNIKQLLSELQFPAENLEIELTEHSLVESVNLAIDTMSQLNHLGVQIALDDFGTGYTSLSYLSKMPVNLLKLDKSLIDNIASDESGQEFIRAVISMGHIMKCEVIAEGVEQNNQVDILKTNECDLIQGYVWSRPISYEEAKTLAKGA